MIPIECDVVQGFDPRHVDVALSCRSAFLHFLEFLWTNKRCLLFFSSSSTLFLCTSMPACKPMIKQHNPWLLTLVIPKLSSIQSRTKASLLLHPLDDVLVLHNSVRPTNSFSSFTCLDTTMLASWDGFGYFTPHSIVTFRQVSNTIMSTISLGKA